MSDNAKEFTPIEGQNFVTVPAGNSEFSQFIGVRGQMMSVGPDAMLRVQFEGQDTETEISAFHVEDITGDSAATATDAGPRIGIYFGTETGNTETIAEQLREKLDSCTINGFADIANCPVSDLLNHDALLLGVSTWNIGDIQYNWEEKLDEIEAQDYTGIKVAIFGLGDAAGYPDTFVDGMGILWDRMKEKGAELVGVWPTDGYEFDDSKGMFDEDHFLGVVIDEDGEEEKTPGRINEWVAQLRNEIGLFPSANAVV